MSSRRYQSVDDSTYQMTMAAAFPPSSCSNLDFLRLDPKRNLDRIQGRAPPGPSSTPEWCLLVLGLRSLLQYLNERRGTTPVSNSAFNDIQRKYCWQISQQILTVLLPRVFSHTEGENEVRLSSKARAWKAFSIQFERLVSKNKNSLTDLACKPIFSSHPIRGIPSEPELGRSSLVHTSIGTAWVLPTVSQTPIALMLTGAVESLRWVWVSDWRSFEESFHTLSSSSLYVGSLTLGLLGNGVSGLIGL